MRDAQHLHTMISNTSDLAEKVSSKVRLLDLVKVGNVINSVVLCTLLVMTTFVIHKSSIKTPSLTSLLSKAGFCNNPSPPLALQNTRTSVK